MHRTRAAVLGAAAIVVAFGLSGCGGDETRPPPVQAPAPITKPPTVTPPPSPEAAPLPPPSALIDVMSRLTDPNVPGTDKVGLIEYATPDDAAELDRISRALRDNGYTPLTFEANDLTWAQSKPGHVIANIVMKAPNQQGRGDFTFPMEFTPSQGSWQLTRQTADMLLQLGEQPTATPTP